MITTIHGLEEAVCEHCLFSIRNEYILRCRQNNSLLNVYSTSGTSLLRPIVEADHMCSNGRWWVRKDRTYGVCSYEDLVEWFMEPEKEKN